MDLTEEAKQLKEFLSQAEKVLQETLESSAPSSQDILYAAGLLIQLRTEGQTKSTVLKKLLKPTRLIEGFKKPPDSKLCQPAP